MAVEMTEYCEDLQRISWQMREDLADGNARRNGARPNLERNFFDRTSTERKTFCTQKCEQQCCWSWDSNAMSSSVSLCNDSEVLFHPDYSCGTAAIRGTEPFEAGSQHYWEIKMNSAVYGTDMMIGVGTSAVDLNNARTSFASLLGKDLESWGLSYLGTVQHAGEMKQYTTKLERESVVGIHLDMWHGTLSFYNNGKSCGIAFRGLQNKELYPMLSSTAARTRMRLERSHCLATTLQYLCCKKISHHISGLDDLGRLPLPPGMKRYLNQHMAWVLQAKCFEK